jgi:hypothetical protein
MVNATREQGELDSVEMVMDEDGQAQRIKDITLASGGYFSVISQSANFKTFDKRDTHNLKLNLNDIQSYSGGRVSGEQRRNQRSLFSPTRKESLRKNSTMTS